MTLPSAVLRRCRAGWSHLICSEVQGMKVFRDLLWGNCRLEQVFEEAAGLGLGGGESGFQAVAEGHQIIDFGDDAVLLGEWGKGQRHGGDRLCIEMRECHP